ncbi:MAG: MBL fold metallo-hydrolase [Verrucomicrobiota bacterium]
MDQLIPIEDCFEDVLGKAINGLSLSPKILAKRLCTSEESILSLLRGERNDLLMKTLAKELFLDFESLVVLANCPAASDVGLPQEVTLHNTPYPIPGYEAMTVNSYSISPPGAACHILIDAGVSPSELSDEIAVSGIRADALLLTHTHHDHVKYFDALSPMFAHTYAPELEPYRAATPVSEKDSIEIGGGWSLQALLTAGHSPGGTTYLLRGAPQLVAFVGDAIFSYSIGKAHAAYEAALSAIRGKILSLPDNTIICPGHGPLTTVAFEKANNPFFA